MIPQSKLLDNIRDWVGRLTRWRTVVTVGSMPNLVRLIRSAGYPHGRKRPLSIAISRPVRRRLQARMHTSDCFVLEEVFLRGAYAELLARTTDAKYIIDCGANVGYASIFFLQRFPGCHILAIEPDDGNVAMCRRNLAPEIDRGFVCLLRAAAWTCDELLSLDQNGMEWGFRVVERRERHEQGLVPVQGYSLWHLIERSGFPRIDVLKIDIEGAELPILQSGLPDALLALIRTIVIELHGDQSAAAFYSALSGKGFSLRRFGEYVVAENQTFLDGSRSPS